MTASRWGKRREANSPGSAEFQFRRQLLQHGDVIAALETAGSDQPLAGDLVQDVFQFMGAVCGVDVYQDQACPCRCKLGDDPFGAVGRPDSDPVAGGNPRAINPAARLSTRCSNSA